MPAIRSLVARIVVVTFACALSTAPSAAQPPGACPPASLFAAPQISIMGTLQRHVEVADLNNDGVPDLVVSTGSTLVIATGALSGSSSVTYTPVHTFSAGAEPTGTSIADFNGDGIPDLASADYSSGTVTIALGLGALAYRAPVSHSVPGTPIGIGVGDFNHDGLPDLVAAAASSASTFTFLPNTGNFAAGADGFSGKYSFGPPRVGYGVAVADLNHDGSQDVVIACVVENDIASALNTCVTSRPTLTVLTVGSGSVERVPDAPDYTLGEVVQLTAHPSAHSSFVSWSGDASGSQNPISVTMDRSKAVVATFVVITHHLTITLAGPGSGVVTSNPNTQDPLEGSTVRLTATPAFGSVFAAWSGDASGSNNPLDVVMAADKAIIATFDIDNTLSPHIVSVSDVPLDQGGKLKLRWNASSLETPGSDAQNLVTQYFVWREIPQAAFALAQAAVPGGDAAGRSFLRTTVAARDYFWEFVVSLPASRFAGYSYTAVTTNDSTEHGNPFTSFMVQARNAAATRWWSSAPDSGYSVDNLSPPTPGPFVAHFGGGSNSFHWGPSHAPDLAGYRIYRGTSGDFTPTSANRIGSPRDTAFVDNSPTTSFYKLAAADIHGNLSHFVLVSPEGPVATLASLVSAEAAADHINLTWYVNEPGMAATLYRRTLSTDWSMLAALFADGQSFMRYSDADVARGETYGYRLGIQEAGGESFFAETYVLAEDTRFAIEGVAPNPAPGGRMTVRFTLPSAAPATIELLDVTGRRVDQRTLSGQAGQQTVELGSATRIAPGLYWVRLRHAGREGSIRAVVLE